MIEFFHGWRRKVGSVALVMACVVMGLWFRSEVIPDFVMIPFEIKICGRELRGLATEKGALVVYVEGRVNHLADEADPEIVFPVDSDSTILDQRSTEQKAGSQNMPVSPVDANSVVVEWLQAEQRRIDPPSEIDFSRPGVWLSISPEPLKPILSQHDTSITCYFPAPEPLMALDLTWIVLPLTLLSAYLLLVPGRKPAVISHVSA